MSQLQENLKWLGKRRKFLVKEIVSMKDDSS